VRAVVERLRPEVRLTPHQDLLLAGIDDERRAEVDRILREHHVLPAEALSLARVHSMACPALPTCGLALAEAERVLPSVIDRLELELVALGLGGERLAIRMTGCPNGCARPYVADLAFVGRSLDRYLVLVGGRRDGTRLNRPYRDLVPASSLVDAVLPLFRLFRDGRFPDVSFGDFCDRVGIDALRAQAAPVREAAANE
jgi:sulfite reductase (ferredoxin)